MFPAERTLTEATGLTDPTGAAPDEPQAAWSMYGSQAPFTTFDEMRDRARQGLPQDVWDFLAGGAGREATLNDNRTALDEVRLRPRVMSGAAMPELRRDVLGMQSNLPVLSAPFGGDALFHPDGQKAVARASAHEGLLSIVPEASSFALEEIAAEAPGAARIMQVNPVGSPTNVAVLGHRARKAGFTTLCVTLDCPTGGWRERNLRNRFEPDLAYFTGNFPADGPIDPREAFGQLLTLDQPTWSWRTLRQTVEEVGLPWIAKGILTADDASAAVEAGACALVVSNHGGRQLADAPAAVHQLPEVVAAVDGRVPVLVDGAMRYGTDIVKALCLGARAVIIGRAVAYALAAGGESGVRAFYDMLRRELRTQLVLLGCASLDDLGPHLLQRAGEPTA